jgi:DTW domain-containing protein
MPKPSQPEVDPALAEATPDCPHCHKPPALCICDSITPIENRVSLLILQHPQEQDRALGTARLTALHFKNAVLKIGLSWPSLSKALGRPVHDPSRWAVLYLGSAKVADLETDRDIVAINRKGDRGQSARDLEGR